MGMMSKSEYGYSRMEKEDPEDVKHRTAQFLIYKNLAQADSRRRPSTLRIRITKLKVKIGKRLKKLRMTLSFAASAAKRGLYRQVLCQLKTWKLLFNAERQSLPSSSVVFK
ncbi:uncharacterized protein LOC124916782 [Impatiens glandulifera]|uniref:uncharacterized protein LOC124916782 n=1 Tax=Impatiens glandulifera TaxID=253017 RepID=UPI001FB11C7B|nr:uncharacterized protein LOC124916782 [Impatiens glandulifera]